MDHLRKLRDYEIDFVGLDVSVCSFMMTVTTFFAGFLIANYNNFDRTIRIPIIFLIISTFSFLYSSNIFANASGEIMSGRREKANKHAVVGTIITEFLGIYLLTAAIPLVITALTNDDFLRYSALIVSLLSLTAYNVSSFSVLSRYIRSKFLRIFYSIILIGLIFSCFLLQSINPTYYNFASVALLGYLLGTSVLIATSKRHYSRIIE